ncbi:IclR family transcriptional regulator domain-containing protein [Neptunomonas antarctica]|uniref:IclR family transcriptional regulator domain-containing protein n=1 Tax=Neptunomonas antarctica TaxID=619304 RepID=UPI00138F33FB|nr:helix-turn-helix domain-containing protein [Neptunomonas antarctica]
MSEVKKIRALARGLQVVEFLGKRSKTSLNELHLATKLPKATLLRILSTFEDHGWVYRGLGDNHYRMSVNGPRFDTNNGEENELIELSSSILIELCNNVGWPSDLAIRNLTKMKIIDSTRRQSLLTINKDVVGFCPHMLWSALGRAYLAFCPHSEREEIIISLKTSEERFDQVSLDGPWVEKLLNETRVRGYATRETGYWGHIVDYPSNVDAIAVPVIKNNKLICCISIAWASGEVTKNQIETEFFPALKAASDQLVGKITY